MQNISTNNTKATTKDLNEYKQLFFSLNENSSPEVYKRLNQLSCLDWTAEVFEEGGLKGLKGLEGEIIVPALFEEVEPLDCNPNWEYTRPAIVVKNGRYGLAKCDGTGTIVLACEHDLIQMYPASSLYVVTDNGRLGLVGSEGETVCPQVADAFFVNCNEIIEYTAGGKHGLVDLSTGLVVEALYEEMTVLPQEDVRVTLNGVAGYLNAANGSFIPEEEAKKDDFEEDLLYCE